jgi:hypothetical protein
MNMAVDSPHPRGTQKMKQPYEAFEYTEEDFHHYFDIPPPADLSNEDPLTLEEIEVVVDLLRSDTPLWTDDKYIPTTMASPLGIEIMENEKSVDRMPGPPGMPPGISIVKQLEDAGIKVVNALLRMLQDDKIDSDLKLALAIEVLQKSGVLEPPSPIALIEQQIQKAPEFLTPIEKKKHYEEIAAKLVADCLASDIEVFLWVIYQHLNALGFSVSQAPHKIRQFVDKK